MLPSTIVAPFVFRRSGDRMSLCSAVRESSHSLPLACDSRNGVTFVPDLSINLTSFQHGEIASVLRGRSGSYAVTICDYHYWTGGGSGRRFDHEQTVFCFDSQRSSAARLRFAAQEKSRRSENGRVWTEARQNTYHSL